MEAFAHNQEQMRNYLKDSFGGMFPFGRFEELGKQNIAFLEQAMRMWNPFKPPGGQSAAGDKPPEPAKPAENQNLDSLKAQMDAIQRQVEALSRQKKDS